MEEPLGLLRKIKGDNPCFILESSTISDKPGIMSLVGVEPPLELIGTTTGCEVNLLDPRASFYMDYIQKKFADNVTETTETSLKLAFPILPFSPEDTARFTRLTSGSVIKSLLEDFKSDHKNFCGFYGAFSYSFVYQYEEVPNAKQNHTPDYHFFLFDNIVVMNAVTSEAEIFITRKNEADCFEAMDRIYQGALDKVELPELSFNVGEIYATPGPDEFITQVECAREHCRKGELMEIVVSRKFTGKVSGDPIALYEEYRKINPSPYMFFFDLNDEFLVGTSPEVMVRQENGKVILRPISGSAPRGKNPIEDHDFMMELFNSAKEKSELDMLVDLARNDLARVCKPGIKIDNYRFIEKYARVMHTESQVSGELLPEYTGFDALISSLNAGTLTGSPKVAAMNLIEDIEQHTRGYYGGAIGYCNFNGDVNTAITIRTAHIKGDDFSYCAGATLLYESDPQSELNEVQIKTDAFLMSLEKFTSAKAQLQK